MWNPQAMETESKVVGVESASRLKATASKGVKMETASN